MAAAAMAPPPAKASLLVRRWDDFLDISTAPATDALNDTDAG
jgi:hypothetical protein